MSMIDTNAMAHHNGNIIPEDDHDFLSFVHNNHPGVVDLDRLLGDDDHNDRDSLNSPNKCKVADSSPEDTEAGSRRSSYNNNNGNRAHLEEFMGSGSLVETIGDDNLNSFMNSKRSDPIATPAKRKTSNPSNHNSQSSNGFMMADGSMNMPSEPKAYMPASSPHSSMGNQAPMNSWGGGWNTFMGNPVGGDYSTMFRTSTTPLTSPISANPTNFGNGSVIVPPRRTSNNAAPVDKVLPSPKSNNNAMAEAAWSPFGMGTPGRKDLFTLSNQQQSGPAGQYGMFMDKSQQDAYDVYPSFANGGISPSSSLANSASSFDAASPPSVQRLRPMYGVPSAPAGFEYMGNTGAPSPTGMGMNLRKQPAGNDNTNPSASNGGLFTSSLEAMMNNGSKMGMALRQHLNNKDLSDNFSSLSLGDDVTPASNKFRSTGTFDGGFGAPRANNNTYYPGLITNGVPPSHNSLLSTIGGSQPVPAPQQQTITLHSNQVIVCLVEFKHGRSGRYEFNYKYYHQQVNPATGLINMNYNNNNNNINVSNSPTNGSSSPPPSGQQIVINASDLLQVGEFVFVEADRGEDLGVISEVLMVKLSDDPLKMAQQQQQLKFDGRVLRRASIKDMQKLAQKVKEEHKALLVCKQKVKEHGLDLEVEDAEFQFDRKKLTFYYRSDKRVDFRELVRDLYKIYRARIWMQKSTDPISNNNDFSNNPIADK